MSKVCGFLLLAFISCSQENEIQNRPVSSGSETTVLISTVDYSKVSTKNTPLERIL